MGRAGLGVFAFQFQVPASGFPYSTSARVTSASLLVTRVRVQRSTLQPSGNTRTKKT